MFSCWPVPHKNRWYNRIYEHNNNYNKSKWIAGSPSNWFTLEYTPILKSVLMSMADKAMLGHLKCAVSSEIHNAEDTSWLWNDYWKARQRKYDMRFIIFQFYLGTPQPLFSQVLVYCNCFLPMNLFNNRFNIVIIQWFNIFLYYFPVSYHIIILCNS